MIVYNLLIFWIVISAVVFQIVQELKQKNGIKIYRKKDNGVYIFLVAIFLFIIGAFKDYSVGKDTFNYLAHFGRISMYSWNEIFEYELEPAFFILNKLLGSMGQNFDVFIIITSALIYGFIGLYVYEESKMPWFSMLLFVLMGFFASSLSLYRQFLALIITMYSVKYVNESKIIKFLFMITLAALFHQSAIIFLMVYPLSKMKIDLKYIVFSILVTIGIYFYGGNLTSIVLSFYSRRQTLVSGEGMGMFLMLLMIVGVVLILKKVYKINNKKFDILCHILILSVITQSFSFHISIMSRVVLYFSIHIITLLPNLLAEIKSQSIRVTGIILTVLFFTIYYIYLLSIDSNGVIPYVFR